MGQDGSGDRLAHVTDVDRLGLRADASVEGSGLDAHVRAGADALRILFESIDEGYCLCEMVVVDDLPVDYRFIAVNPLFEQLTGLSDPIGRTATELVPGLEQHWIDTYARVGLGGETLRFEQVSEAMGKWFDVFAVPVPPCGRFALVFRDTTARRAFELRLTESEQRFRSMTEELPMLVWKHGPDGELVWVNQTLCDFVGATREQISDHGVRFEHHPDDPEPVVPAVRAARIEHRPYHGQSRVRRADGAWRWIEAWGRPRFDSGGEYIGYLGAALDVTERVDAESTTRRSAQFLRRLIDNLFAFVGVLTPDGTLIEANRAPLEAAGIELDDVIGRKFWEARWWTVDEATQAQLRAAVDEAAAGRTVRYDVQVRGQGDELIWIDFQLAPLVGDDGVVTHLVPSGHVISERIETERRLAAALDAERVERRRVELLQRNATQLAGAITIDDIATCVLGELRDSLGLDLTALNVVVGGCLEVVAPSKMPEAAVDRYQQVSVDADLPGPISIRTNQPVILGSYDAIARRFPDVVHPANGLPRVETLASLPLRSASGQAIGAMFLASPDANWFDAATLEMLTSIAGQTGLALERAQLHEALLAAREEEHAIALQLQRALLPERVEQHPRLQIAARYLAASDLMAVGGDWYDTFGWPDGRVAVTVGDVVGHDLEAATTMGRLRIGVNALMGRTDPKPDAVLDQYGEYGAALGPAFATAVCVVVDGDTGELQVASAGHPVPLVVASDGTVEWLMGSVSPPLGMPLLSARPVGRRTLEPGATVVLFSDGLVERRREHLDAGFARLASSAERHAGLCPEDLADAIVADLTSSDVIADDVIVVCVRWAGPAVSAAP
jgi:PAS domain S-box-containing protein